MTYESFCGGVFETNCYLLRAPDGHILFDAPDGACDWLDRSNVDLKLLLLTHGHIDHVQDVAKLKRRFDCQIGCSVETVPMISDRDFFRGFGFELEIEPALLEGRPGQIILATRATPAPSSSPSWASTAPRWSARPRPTRSPVPVPGCSNRCAS